MKKNQIISILIIIVLVIIVIIFWQKNKIKNVTPLGNSGKSVISDNAKETTPIENKVNPIIVESKKPLPPAKDEEAIKANFKYEVSLSKILDKKWQLVEVVNYDDTIFTPKKSGAFSITFKKDGILSGTTDCNSFFGKYTLKNKVLKILSLGQTEMYCEGSEEVKFITYLGQVNGFMFNGEENLVLGFDFDSGSMIFKQ